ncbi:MAG: hypothetical protein ACR2RE_09720 [Geminicoccaceae bacterium]
MDKEGHFKVKTVSNGSLDVEKLRQGWPSNKKFTPLESAQELWKSRGLLTDKETSDIRRLTDFRNDVAHRAHLLASDLSAYRWIRDMRRRNPKSRGVYDYGVMDEMKHFVEVLPGRLRGVPWIIQASAQPMMFETAEKALLQELCRLGSKIDRLVRNRRLETETVQRELDVIRATFAGDEQPMHPYHAYDNGRLTERGAEVCYRMFDAGHSTIAVAYAMGLSLKSVRYRRKKWGALNGPSRPAVRIDRLPIRPFHLCRDD